MAFRCDRQQGHAGKLSIARGGMGLYAPFPQQFVAVLRLAGLVGIAEGHYAQRLDMLGDAEKFLHDVLGGECRRR